MQPDFVDEQFPARPYPGARPAHSFVHIGGGGGYVLDPSPGGRWRLRDGSDLEDRLASWNAAPLAARTAVLAYGSNACPSKITWLREAHGLRAPVVVLRVNTTGLAAVWAAGFRVVDDQRPATLAADPGGNESHALWLATDDQLEALDRCEGRGQRYDLVRLDPGYVRLETGTVVPDVHAYLGRSRQRMPLLVGGRAVRCADLDQARARDLVGTPAESDGLRPPLRVKQ